MAPETTTQTGTDVSKNDIKLDLQTSHEGNVSVAHGEAHLVRKFSLFSMLALAFSVLGTWSTISQNMGTGLNNGGPVSILYGLILVTFCNICVALSLGEFVSAMPTALGQAYWVYRLCPTPTGRIASYMCGWINNFGWWTLTASQVGFMTSFLLGIKVMFDNDWAGAGEGWVQFLVYLGITFVFTLVNAVGCRRDKFLPWFNNFVGITFAGLFFCFCLVFLICVGTKPDLSFQPASFALGAWINNTGWPSGVVWFTGLVQASYGLTAFDSVIHMVEEMPEPRKDAPKAIYLAVIFGAITGFILMVVCMFSIQDIDNVVNSATGLPFMQLTIDAAGLNGAAALMALFVFNGICQGVSVATTGPRLTWGFARDGGIPFHRYFANISPYWKAPVRAIWLQGFLIALVGLLYLFANTVLEAILAVSTIALTISYAIPIIVLLIVGRDKLPPGNFRLGQYGPVINWISVIYCVVTTVFFFFPGSPDPAPSDMNYAIAVFGVMLVVSIGFWFIQGKSSFLKTVDAEERLIHARELEDESFRRDAVETTKRV